MQNEFSRRAALRTIVLLAWPTVLEQILQTAVQYVDSAMVGRIGAHATAAVGSTATIHWLVNSSISALSIGFLAYIAREIGAQHPERARQASAQATLVTLITGALFTFLALSLSSRIPRWMNAGKDIAADASRYFFILYAPMLFRTANIIYGTCLRAAGDTRTPLRVNLTVNLTNIVLNFLLIYPSRTASLFGIRFTLPGAGLGVTGAALASASAFTVGGIGMTLALWRHPLISPRGISLRPDGKILRPCLKVALPCALQRFGTSFGYVAFASMINGLGTTAIAAHSIANTAESAFYIPGYGMQTAAATLSGNCYGARDPQRMKRLCRMMIALEVLLMALSGGTLLLSARALMGVFTRDAAVIELGTKVLRMVAVTEPVYGLAVILEGIFQGVGDTKSAFCFNLLGMWGVRILGTFIALRFLGGGLTAAWGCMIAHNLLLGALLLARFLRGRWNPLNREMNQLEEASHGI
ncbi:MAG: MATE family efflux transporter [Eubacteriales bacterium]|nr:MATE family efflux transporter [Eubacteriales bacterium]